METGAAGERECPWSRVIIPSNKSNPAQPTVNPINFKAHPYLARWVELLTEPSSQSATMVMEMLAILLASNLLWAAGIPWLLRKLERLAISPINAYAWTLPASFLYSPLMLTLIQDVLGHSFELRNRWFLLLMILVSSQTLTAFYAFALRHPRSDAPIGLESGLAVSLFLLLVSIPSALILIGFNTIVPFF